MADISAIKLPDGITYNIKDTSKSTVTNLVNGSVTGSVRGINTAIEDANYTIGTNAFAMGTNTEASGDSSHAEGKNTEASGDSSHAEGSNTVAGGRNAHAEGNSSYASGVESHAEGWSCSARGVASHVEGFSTDAMGTYAHAEGQHTEAFGVASHAGGTGTTAQRASQMVIGEYNDEDTAGADVTERGKYAFIIGNGAIIDLFTIQRTNAFAVDWGGNVEIALDTSAQSGTTDGDLYSAITALGWGSEVIV